MTRGLVCFSKPAACSLPGKTFFQNYSSIWEKGELYFSLRLKLTTFNIKAEIVLWAAFISDPRFNFMAFSVGERSIEEELHRRLFLLSFDSNQAGQMSLTAAVNGLPYCEGTRPVNSLCSKANVLTCVCSKMRSFILPALLSDCSFTTL